MAHLSPIHEWKSMSPCVVCALKLGAMLPSRRRGCSSVAVASERRRTKVRAAGRNERKRGRGAARVRNDAIVVGID